MAVASLWQCVAVVARMERSGTLVPLDINSTCLHWNLGGLVQTR